MGNVVVEESSRPIQASFHPCFQRAAPCHRAWLEELLLLMAAGERQMYASEVSRKAAGRSSLIRAERWRTLWRVRKTTALAFWRGQRLGNHRTSKVCPVLFHFSQRLSIPRFLVYRLAASLRALLSVARDPYPSFASFLCQVEATRHFGARCSTAFVCLLVFRLQASVPGQSGPTSGPTSGGGIRSVSSHTSSINLTFASPRSRWAAVLQSPAMMSARFFLATFLSWSINCFATSRLFAVVLLRCAETAVYVLLSSFGHLLNRDLTKRYLGPKESCFDARHLVLALHTLWFKSAFAPFPTQLCGRIVLASRFLPQICPQISEHEGHANEDQNAEPHLAMDPFFPEFSCGVMYIF